MLYSPHMLGCLGHWAKLSIMLYFPFVFGVGLVLGDGVDSIISLFLVFSWGNVLGSGD